MRNNTTSRSDRAACHCGGTIVIGRQSGTYCTSESHSVPPLTSNTTSCARCRSEIGWARGDRWFDMNGIEVCGHDVHAPVHVLGPLEDEIREIKAQEPRLADDELKNATHANDAAIDYVDDARVAVVDALDALKRARPVGVVLDDLIDAEAMLMGILRQIGAIEDHLQSHTDRIMTKRGF